MISLSGFGADSPWRDYVAFGMSTEQMGGFTHLTGYPDGDPLFTGTTGGDLFAGVMGANALSPRSPIATGPAKASTSTSGRWKPATYT